MTRDLDRDYEALRTVESLSLSGLQRRLFAHANILENGMPGAGALAVQKHIAMALADVAHALARKL